MLSATTGSTAEFKQRPHSSHQPLVSDRSWGECHVELCRKVSLVLDLHLGLARTLSKLHHVRGPCYPTLFSPDSPLLVVSDLFCDLKPFLTQSCFLSLSLFQAKCLGSLLQCLSLCSHEWKCYLKAMLPQVSALRSLLSTLIFWKIPLSF